MRLTSPRAYTRPQPVPKMPPGLMELMDGLARDVLMHNPTNVYEFCAKHMEKLLEIRDGPPSGKSLTLEQKILKAQEKMRQKAQERREKFDREMKLHGVSAVESGVSSKDLELPGPSHRAPIHHDLKDASEVEISHVPQVDKELFIDNSIADHVSPSKHESPDAVIDNLIGPEIQNFEIISDDDGQENEIKSHEKIDDEPIFGKVERDENADNIEDAKLGEIIDMTAIDSPLQTITEASEENLVTDNVIILPKITIGEEGLDPYSLSDESQEMQSSLIIEANHVDIAEQKSENENKSESLKPNDILDCADVENETSIPNSISEPEIIKTEIVETVEKNYNNELTKNVTQIEDNTETIQMSTADAIDTAEVTLDDDNVDKLANCNKEETDNTDNPNAEIILGHDTEAKSSDGNLVIESQHKDTDEDKQTIANSIMEDSNLFENKASVDLKESDPNFKAETEHRRTLESPTETVSVLTATSDDEHVKMNEKDEVIAKVIPDLENINMTNERETDLEAEKDDASVNTPEFSSMESNKTSESVKNEAENNEDIQKAEDEKLSNDGEKSNDNAEISLQKSESTENTNEDSIISIVESDLSKTDDDATQNSPNMDLETAAVTIQKVFRSLMFKSRNSTFEDTTNDDHNSIDEDNDKKEEYYAAANLNKERRPLGITRMDTVLQTVNEEKSLSLSTDDSSTLSSAATTIQAHVRGFLVRNRLNSSKTYSMNSLVNSHEVLDTDPEQHKNKTILNIHIVPEEGNYLSRDESLMMSMDLSLDGSPPSSVNLHPLSFDITERRKMLKREDAVQSVSPPSNNSGKLSEDSVKEVLINENGVLEREPTDDKTIETDDATKELDSEVSEVTSASTVTPTTVVTVSKSEDPIKSPRDNVETALKRNGGSLTKLSSDESDVVTPFVPSPRSLEVGTKLLHSGEFHDVVLPTKVSRQDTSAVREFKNVLVYFLLWNDS